MPSDRGRRGDVGDRGRVRGGLIGRRGWIAALVVVVVTAILAAIAYFSPLFSVRRIVVDGLVGVTEAEVLDALGVAEGTPLMQVDARGAARRVAGHIRVREARIRREYPSTLRVTVEERRAVLYEELEGGAHLVDRSGVEFAIEPPPPGVPRVVAMPVGTDDGGAGPRRLTPEAVGAAITVEEALGAGLRPLVGTIEVWSVNDVRLLLTDGRVVFWGAPDDSAAKAGSAEAVLGMPGRHLNVTNPDMPTWKE